MSPEKTKTKKITTTTKKPVKKEEKKIIETPKKTVQKKPVKKTKPKLDPEAKKALFAPKIEKVTINIGVGEAGERLKKAESVLNSITGHKPIETLSKTTNKDWGIRKRMPLGCKVTLRGTDADTFLTEALATRENKMADYSFDDEGNLSFGIPDHTLFKSQKYDPKIGIFGMDVCITMKKPGYRVKHRRIATKRIPHRHRVKKEETIKFFSDTFKVEVIE
jgi:large subunit ribosomal protein L5